MNRSRKVYTYLLPIIIILNGYASGVSGLSLGAIVMNLFNVYALVLFFMNKKKVNSFFGRTIVLLYVFVLLSCIAYFIYGINDILSIVKNLLKVLTWFLGITFTATMLFDYSIFKLYYRKFCIVCTIYLLLQMVSWNTIRVYLPNLFSFGLIQPLYEQYSSAAYVNYLSSIGFGRFSSFFAEPAYYGIMMVVGLIIIFFDDCFKGGMSKRIKFEVLLIILGIWISTSTAAILFVIFIIVVYFLKTNVVNKLWLAMIALCMCILFMLFVTDKTLANFFIEKLLTMGTSGRIGQSYSKLSNLSIEQQILGVGFANTGIVIDASYMNQFTGMLMEFGIVGFLFFLWYMGKIFTRNKSTALHVLVIIYMAAMAQGGYLFNLYGILIFSVILNLEEIKIEKRRKEKVSE